MANEKNLTHRLTESDLRKGGQKSGETRRKKKELKKVVKEVLNGSVNKYPVLADIAMKYGINDTATVKELITLGAVLKSAADGSIDDLIKFAKFIGEDKPEDDNNQGRSGRTITFEFTDTSARLSDEEGQE